MRHMYRMYEYTKFVHGKVAYAEIHRDADGTIPYQKDDDMRAAYARLRSMHKSEVAHLQEACISNGYLWRSRFGDYIFVDNGKGAKLLDSLLGVPFGLIEEVLRQYKYSVTLFSGVAFLGATAALWHILDKTVHHLWPHIQHLILNLF